MISELDFFSGIDFSVIVFFSKVKSQTIFSSHEFDPWIIFFSFNSILIIPFNLHIELRFIKFDINLVEKKKIIMHACVCFSTKDFIECGTCIFILKHSLYDSAYDDKSNKVIEIKYLMKNSHQHIVLTLTTSALP